MNVVIHPMSVTLLLIEFLTTCSLFSLMQSTFLTYVTKQEMSQTLI